MSRILAELEQLERALNRLEATLASRERRVAAELTALRQTVRDQAEGEQTATEALAQRVDQVIDRLEAVLEH